MSLASQFFHVSFHNPFMGYFLLEIKNKKADMVKKLSFIFWTDEFDRTSITSKNKIKMQIQV